jgi:hypothetical protein
MQTSSGVNSKSPLASGGEGISASNPSLAPPPGSPPGGLRGPPPPAYSPQPAAEQQDQLASQLALLLKKITLQDLERHAEREVDRVRAEEAAVVLIEARAASAAASAAVQAQLQQSAETASASAAAIAGLTTSLLALKEEHEVLKKPKALLYAKFPGDKNKEKRESLLQISEDETYGVFGGIHSANTDALFAKAIEAYKVKVQDARFKKAAAVGAGSGKPAGGKPAALNKKVTMQPKAAGAE